MFGHHVVLGSSQARLQWTVDLYNQRHSDLRSETVARECSGTQPRHKRIVQAVRGRLHSTETLQPCLYSMREEDSLLGKCIASRFPLEWPSLRNRPSSLQKLRKEQSSVDSMEDYTNAPSELTAIHLEARLPGYPIATLQLVHIFYRNP